MKKIIILITVFFAISTQGIAQKFIDVYQNGKVGGSMFSPDIDSVSISGNDFFSRRINFWRSGKLSNSFFISSIDSVKVFHSEDEPLVYLSILGFNQELYPKSIDVLAGSTYNFYTNFVSNLTRKDGTLLYYAVDNALDMLTQYNFTTPITSVNLVTFTDGLDQGSLMMATNFENESAYLSYLSHRIGTTRVRGLPLTAYSLGLRGNDVTDYTQFLTNLRQLSTSDDNTIEVNSMSGVQDGLKDIADQIISISNRQTISTKIPGQSNETHVCFTFDGESPENSSLYIEGVFNLSDRSLHNVAYGGIRATSGKTVEGIQNGIFVTYTFTGLQRTDGNGLIPVNNIRHFNQAKGSSTWQINSEFTPGNNTQTTVTHSGAAVLLLLDCSSSLGSQFNNMKTYANNFIRQLANNAASFSITAPTTVIAAMDDEEMAVNVSWGAVKHAEYYAVYRSRYSYYDFTKIADSLTFTNWRDEAPLQGSNYYRIYAIGHGLQEFSTSNVVICNIDAPANVIASMDDDMNIIVSWDSVKYANSYSVYRSSNSSSNFIKVADGITSTKWLDSAPLQGNNYYRIYAISNGMTSAPSSTSNVVKFELETPQNVTAVMDENEWAVDVCWKEVKYAEYYSVYRSNDAQSNFTKVADSLCVTNWHDEAPQQGANYYRICAIGHGLQSSNTSNVVVCEIAAPTKLLAVMDENEWAVNVSWDATKYAEFYSVYRSSNSSSDFTKVVDSLTVTNWRDEAPILGNNYYCIYAMGHGATSVASSISAVVRFELSSPANVTAVMDDDMNVDVSWDAVKFAESYSVYRSNDKFFGFTKIADNILKTTWRDATPLHGANYYRINATGHNLTSAFSKTSNVVNYEITAPTNVTASLDEYEMAVNVSWDAVRYAESYNIYRSNSQSNVFTLVKEGVATTKWKDESPMIGNNYYRVCAIGHGLTSPMSSSSNEVYVVEFLSFCPDNHHPHMIDLGLPSGTMWSCCNVGATTPKDNGAYYAWGEIEEKDEYDRNTYIYNSSYGPNNGYPISGTQYDVAHVKWGSTWQMPTYEQFIEFVNKCNYEFAKFNGIEGGKFTGPNGAAIFLPATGQCSGSDLCLDKLFGYYWSDAIVANNLGNAYALELYKAQTGGTSLKNISITYGLSVRPISGGTIIQTLQLSSTSLTLGAGNVGMVEIISGNGNYTVTSSNSSVATATIEGSLVKVTAISVGSATITVNDTKSGQTATIKVEISDGIQIIIDDNNNQIDNESEILNNRNSWD